MDIHISVRNLVEFILRSGDIDNRKAVAPENAMQEGSRIHRMIQRRMGPIIMRRFLCSIFMRRRITGF